MLIRSMDRFFCDELQKMSAEEIWQNVDFTVKECFLYIGQRTYTSLSDFSMNERVRQK